MCSPLRTAFVKMMGIMNSLMVETDMNASTVTITSVVIVVRIVLFKVSLIERFAISTSLLSFAPEVFNSSLILSKMIIVALME